MSVEFVLGITAAVFLVACGLVLLATVRYGRQLFRLFENQFPQQYIAAGRPLPGLWESPRRRAHFRFLIQREFDTLQDPQLAREFEKLRQTEVALLIFMLAGFAALGLAIVVLGSSQ